MDGGIGLPVVEGDPLVLFALDFPPRGKGAVDQDVVPVQLQQGQIVLLDPVGDGPDVLAGQVFLGDKGLKLLQLAGGLPLDEIGLVHIGGQSKPEGQPAGGKQQQRAQPGEHQQPDELGCNSVPLIHGRPLRRWRNDSPCPRRYRCGGETGGPPRSWSAGCGCGP